jgi:caffeoyl-CoA O-methyltransferase
MSEMILDPEAYFRRLVAPRSDLLKTLEEEAQREDVPIVGPLVGELLYILARAVGARRILELGTATGYSAIFLAEACAETGGRLTTLERDAGLARRAADNLARAGFARWADIRCVDAREEMARTEDVFDFVFMDIEKEDYAAMLPHCSRIVKAGGLLVADNVGFADADPFNRAVYGHPSWRSASLYGFLPRHSPEKDGLCLAVHL